MTPRASKRSKAESGDPRRSLIRLAWASTSTAGPLSSSAQNAWSSMTARNAKSQGRLASNCRATVDAPHAMQHLSDAYDPGVPAAPAPRTCRTAHRVKPHQQARADCQHDLVGGPHAEPLTRLIVKRTAPTIMPRQLTRFTVRWPNQTLAASGIRHRDLLDCLARHGANLHTRTPNLRYQAQRTRRRSFAGLAWGQPADSDTKPSESG